MHGDSINGDLFVTRYSFRGIFCTIIYVIQSRLISEQIMAEEEMRLIIFIERFRDGCCVAQVELETVMDGVTFLRYAAGGEV